MSKIKINILFIQTDDNHTPDKQIIKHVNMGVIELNLYLIKNCFFENIQRIKSFIKKYIISNIFIEYTEVNFVYTEQENNEMHITMLDNMLYFIFNYFEKLKHVTYSLNNTQNTHDKKTTLFRNIMFDYFTLLFSTSNVINPETLQIQFIQTCKKFMQDKKFYHKTIIAEKDRLNLLYAVGKGGEYLPRLFVCGFGVNNEADLVEHHYHYCFIGKGVTFDSGGYSLKPSDAMIDMSIDKSGSIMALYSAMYNYITYKITTIVITPIVQNMIAPHAYTPGEIITSNLGVNVHIGNTDAEGRVILADAIEYAVQYFQFNKCFIFATLTGAVIIAIGYGRTAYMTNDQQLSQHIEQVAQTTGEKLHRLPLDKHYDSLIKDNIRHQAIISNISTKTRCAGTIVGGKFLEYFYTHAHKKLEKKNVPSFCHFDIAGLIELDYLDNLTYSFNLFFLSQLCQLCQNE